MTSEPPDNTATVTLVVEHLGVGVVCVVDDEACWFSVRRSKTDIAGDDAADVESP